jgi:hypothetical protein
VNSVSGFYKIKLPAAVINSKSDGAQQASQPLVYRNVIGLRDCSLFQGPGVRTAKVKCPSTIWPLIPQTLLDVSRCSPRFVSPLTVKATLSMYHSLHTDRMGQISLHN